MVFEEMLWQDIVISIVNIMLLISLTPSLYESFKTKKITIPIFTSLPTAIGLYVMSIAFLTLDLYFSSIIVFLTATEWFILFIMRILYKNETLKTN